MLKFSWRDIKIVAVLSVIMFLLGYSAMPTSLGQCGIILSLVGILVAGIGAIILKHSHK